MAHWRSKTDDALERKLGELYDLDAADQTDDDLAMMEDIEDELSAREEYRDQHADTPSLQDAGITLGSYAT